MSGAAGGAPEAGRSERRRLIRWGFWFFLAHALLLGIVGLRYLSRVGWPQEGLALLFTGSAWVGHFGLLGFAPWLVLVLPLTLLLPKHRLILPIGVLLAAACLALLLVDSLVFAQNYWHVTPLTAPILGWQTWAFGALYLGVFTALYAMVARTLWRRVARPARHPLELWIGAFLVGALALTQVLHIWADVRYYVPITRLSHVMPLMRPASAKGWLDDLGVVDLESSREQHLVLRIASSAHGSLTYPLEALVCEPPELRLNILLIAVDGMRADMVDAEVAPNIHAFGKRGIRFTRHFSGGNSSRTGLFSLFYGLPATYWRRFRDEQRSAVLIDQLLVQGYRVGVFSTAPLHRPLDLDRTAFAGVPDLVLDRRLDKGRLETTDIQITRDWIAWLDEVGPDEPFFGFLFYDAPPALYPRDYEPVFPPDPNGPPMREDYADYKTSIHFADSLVGRVIDDLERRGLLERTVVVVTSDHGEEFDENGLGFKGHGSAYSEIQLETPFVVHWPGREPGVVVRRTSHMDVAPTLLEDVLGCTTPPDRYSSGHNLFGDGEWDLLIAGSYADFAILDADGAIIVTHPSGSVEVRDWDYRLVAEPRIDHDVVSRALHETTRFLRR